MVSVSGYVLREEVLKRQWGKLHDVMEGDTWDDFEELEELSRQATVEQLSRLALEEDEEQG